MSSADVYEGIHAEGICAIRSGGAVVDPALSGLAEDRRRGISLIIPLAGNGSSYRRLIEAFVRAEPEQYFYPFGDLHVTVLDLVQARHGFEASAELVQGMADIAEEALRGARAFDLEFKGIAFSRGAGLLRGFDGGALAELRKRIRIAMERRGIPNDERYEARTAHVTFCRFKRALADPEGFAEIIERHRDFVVGSERIRALELVEHDWYNRRERKRTIAAWPLEEQRPFASEPATRG